MSDGEEIISSLFPGLKRRATSSHELKRGRGDSCSLEIGLEVGNKGSTSECVGIVSIFKRHVLTFENAHNTNIQLNIIDNQSGLEQ